MRHFFFLRVETVAERLRHMACHDLRGDLFLIFRSSGDSRLLCQIYQLFVIMQSGRHYGVFLPGTAQVEAIFIKQADVPHTKDSAYERYQSRLHLINGFPCTEYPGTGERIVLPRGVYTFGGWMIPLAGVAICSCTTKIMAEKRASGLYLFDKTDFPIGFFQPSTWIKCSGRNCPYLVCTHCASTLPHEKDKWVCGMECLFQMWKTRTPKPKIQSPNIPFFTPKNSKCCWSDCYWLLGSQKDPFVVTEIEISARKLSEEMTENYVRTKHRDVYTGAIQIDVDPCFDITEIDHNPDTTDVFCVAHNSLFKFDLEETLFKNTLTINAQP